MQPAVREKDKEKDKEKERRGRESLFGMILDERAERVSESLPSNIETVSRHEQEEGGTRVSQLLYQYRHQYRNGNQYGNVPTNSKRTSESHMSPDRGSAVPGLLTTLLSSAQGKLPAVCEGATRDEETPCVTCPSNHNHASPCMVTQGG